MIELTFNGEKEQPFPCELGPKAVPISEFRVSAPMLISNQRPTQKQREDCPSRSRASGLGRLRPCPSRLALKRVTFLIPQG
jgi:hypothetical protein